LILAALLKEKGLRFDTLDISDNNIREKAGLEIIRNLQYCKRLILDKNFTERVEAETLMSSLGTFVNTHPELYSLSIVGNNSTYKLGRSIKPLFGYLSKNTSLEELDITGNNIGDTSFLFLCAVIRTSAIRTLRCDANNITYAGYITLQSAVKYNKSFRHLQIPLLDIELEKDPKTKQNMLETVISIISENRYKKKKEVKQWSQNILDFDQKWPTPTTKTLPLLKVPPELPSVTMTLPEPPDEFSLSWFYLNVSPRRKKKDELTVPTVQTSGESDDIEDDAALRRLNRRYSEGKLDIDLIQLSCQLNYFNNNHFIIFIRR